MKGYFLHLKQFLTYQCWEPPLWCVVLWPLPAPDGFHENKYKDISDKIYRNCEQCIKVNRNSLIRCLILKLLFSLIMVALTVLMVMYIVLGSDSSPYLAYNTVYDTVENKVISSSNPDWNMLFNFNYQNGIMKVSSQYNNGWVWSIFVLYIAFACCCIDTLYYHLSVSNDPFYKETLKSIYSNKWSALVISKPFVNVSNPWKSLDPYILIVSIIYSISLAITDVTISSMVPSYSFIATENVGYLWFDSLKYCVSNVSVSSTKNPNIFEVKTSITMSPLYLTLYIIGVVINLLAVFSCTDGDYITNVETKHAIFVKCKDESFLTSINLPEEKIKEVNDIINDEEFDTHWTIYYGKQKK